MSDNPMYWPGHQRPAWHQQPPTAQNSMSHYATHPANMLGNPMAPGMPGDPSLQMQSSIPGRHQTHQSSLPQHQSTLGPSAGTQSSLYSSMMPAPGATSSVRPSSQLSSNSHLSASTQGIPPHPGMQQAPHPQSHYSHQYSSLASSYWNPPPMNSQSSMNSSTVPGSSGPSQASSGGPPPDGGSSYHSSSASPLTMPNEGRGSIPTNSSSSMQQPSSSFHSPKDIQSTSDHMMSYDRSRGSMSGQQQHPSAMMSQTVPSSSANNLSPTQNQLSMQSRLQSQSQLDSMRSMSQQPSAVSNWSNSYYGQASQSPYPSVMNPYMPYGSSSGVPNHAASIAQPSTRPAISQKPPTNSSDLNPRATYPPHGASMYGQAPPTGSTNGSYYGYDSYYNQVASQANSDPYLTHPNPASQNWSSATHGSQILSAPPVPLQPSLRPQTGPSGATVHPQSPSATTSSLPSISSRPPPSSQTPDRSPAPQHSTSYPSPKQQSSSSKSTSNSLAQLEQMVMPGSTQNTTAPIKSPTHRSSTSSPSTNAQQQQLQYSYNSSGQGSYFSTGTGASTNQSSYFPTYDQTGVEMQKTGWSDQVPVPPPMMNPVGPPPGPVMMDSGPNAYGQSGYDGASAYGDYTTLSAPNSSCNQPRFSTSGDTAEPHPSEKGDPYAIDSQTFDDYEDQSSTSKAKKSRAKKGDEKVKKERKPRAPRGSKAGTSGIQPQSPSGASSSSIQSIQNKQPLSIPSMTQTPEMSPAPQQPSSVPYPSPGQQSLQPMKSTTDPSTQIESITLPGPTSTASPSSKSPAQRLSTDSPNMSAPTAQYSYNEQANYYSSAAASQNSGNFYSPYQAEQANEQTGPEMPKPEWNDQISGPSIGPPSGSVMMDIGQNTYSQPSYDNTNSYGEYTALSTPNNSCNQQAYPPSNVMDPQASEKSDPFNTELQGPDDQEDNLSSTKGKKSRAKKGDEKLKKERKPRAPRGAKASVASAQALSPSGTSSLSMPPTGSISQTPETASHQPLPSAYPSPSHQILTDKEPLDLDPASVQCNLQDTSPSSQSPAIRLSTDSPSQALQQPNDQPNFYATEEGQAQVEYQLPLEPPPHATPIKKSEEKPKKERKSRAAKASQPLTSEKSVTTPPPTGEESTLEIGSFQTTPTDLIPSKKSDSKPKRERKSRAKVPQPQPQPPPPDQTTSTPPPATDEVGSEASASQSTLVDTTPTDPKPKRIRIRDSSSKGKKKLPKFALKFAKTKKRKRLGSSDNDQSDLDKTPPPSPDEVESGVQKRRSARNTKKLKYNDDIELGFSESDDDSQVLPKSKKAITSSNASNNQGDSTMAEDSVVIDEPTVFAAPVEDTMVVEKIMAHRTGKRELEPEPGEVLPPDGTHIDVEEFYVKYKNLSYLHCDWRTLEELEKGDRRVAQKIKRYKQKKDSSNLFSFMDEDLFDPQYCEVDRILAVNEVEEMVTDDDDDEDKPSEEVAIKTMLDSTDEAKPADPETKPDKETIIDTDAKPPSTEDETIKPGMDKSNSDAEVQSVNDRPIIAKADVDNQDTNDVSFKSDAMEVDDVQVKEPIKEAVQSTIPEETANETKVDDEKPKKLKKKISRHYLVKWRGLSYEDSTWEREDDLDQEKIKHFLRFKDPPPKSKWRSAKRPKPEDWVRKECSPIYKNNNTLREYQLEGINWLSFCWHQGRNCILADEMGLGKTIQSIAFVNEIYQHGINGPYLIIVPLSTVGNWAREFETWTDLNVITYHGSSTSREMLKEYEMFYRNEQGNRITSYYKFQVMITTFEIILSDCLDLREIPWKCCIIDEAHRLKNRNCKLLEGLRLLNMEHRVLLTGTPLQNNVEELFSLLNFLEPTQFSSTEQFLQEFGDLKTEAQVDKLKVILKPMMLRRLKEDVEKSLAPKEETIVEVELTNIQKKYYRAILEKNFSFLSKGSTSNNMPNLMNTMMELRKCCIHPYLINGAEDQILYEARQAKLAGGEPMSSHQAMVNSSGKLVLIDKLLPRLRADGHRVLIFSQMVRCLDILEDYVTHKHYPYERIDGRVRGSERQQAIDRYSKPGSDRFVFLLCTRAGGLGINLTAADTVIIFDSDWNPQNDLQAQARCHRIGQSKAVKIYRLICRNTYEREMFDKASLKLGLDKAVLQSMNTQKGGTGELGGQLTKKEIEELLRKGAYGALMDDDNAGDKFCEEDIDQILQRRTQVITIDNSEAKGSTFSKATFSSSNNREDIELDDPNFWEKWAKKANIESDDHKDDLVQLAPRRRTQTKRYGADGHLIDMSDLDSSEEDEETISMRTRGSRSGRQTKMTPTSGSKRSKRHRFPEFDDEEFMAGLDGGYWSKSDCLSVEKGLLTYGWGRWEEIIANQTFKRELTAEDCESICRVIILYCLTNYKGDEKIKSFAWELITPPEELNKLDVDHESSSTSRGRKPKVALLLTKKTVTEELADAKWPKEAKNDPLIALPDDQYRRHLQRNCNRLLIRVKLLHYLKNDILRGYLDKITTDCHINEIDLPSVLVDGDPPAPWWDDDADKSLLVGIYKHGHDKFNLMRQDPTLCFLQKCGPPNKDELIAEMTSADRSADDLEDENRDPSIVIRSNRKAIKGSLTKEESDASELLDSIVDNVVKGLGDNEDGFDENKNTIRKDSSVPDSLDDACENGVTETSQTETKMDITDEDSLTNEASIDTTLAPNVVANIESITSECLLFPHANDLNQRFRRLITAYQRNSKKLEIKLAQKARDDAKKEKNSKFEAAKNEREERKRFLAQKWSRREEADFFRAISSFGVEYDPLQKKHDWNKFRLIGKLDKKLDDTLEEYYKAFVIMCKRVLSRPLTADEEKCPINVDTITEERALRCLTRIDFLNKIREQVINHPQLDNRLQMCAPQSDLPDWWENGKHDKDLLMAAAKHGLTRLDYNLAHDPDSSFYILVKELADQFIQQTPTPILITLEQLQDLLESNGVAYTKDLDLQDDSEDVRTTLNQILDKIESEETPSTEGNNSYKSFAELVDGPHSKISDDNHLTTKTPPKTTRSSANLSSASRPATNLSTRREANTVVKIAESSEAHKCVRITSISGRTSRSDDIRLVEVTPILPQKIPDELTKNFEAGEITITIQSESALLVLEDESPITLNGAINPITLKIRWPKDKAIQSRLENLVYLVEKNEWPSQPKASVPTISLPNHLTSSLGTSSTNLITSSPGKNDKFDLSLGSPKSDISNISSLTSKQDSKDQFSDLSIPRGRRGRGRRPRQFESEQSSQDFDLPRDDRQATAKLRNLLSQGPSSSRGAGSSSGDKLSTKFGGNKQGANLSSLLASFKQKRSGAEPHSGIPSTRSSRGADKNLLDLNAAGASNLLPQILANMKPEFRDLLSNRDTAQLLFNSLSNMTGGANLAATLGSQISLDSLLNVTKSQTKGPPPAHQRSDNPPTAHGNQTTTRELRRNSQNNRESSPPSINLRSTRGKGSLANIDSMSHHQQKQVELAHSKSSGASKRRGRPSSTTSDSPPGMPGADILDLSSLPLGGSSRGNSSSSRSESRSRRHREQIPNDDPTSRSNLGGSVATKANLKAGARQQPLNQEPEQELAPEKNVRTTRASKRIGSRIDALALNLQAKRMNRGDSPSSDLSPPLPKEQDDNVNAAHKGSKSSNDQKAHNSKAPPAAHSGFHKSASSSSGQVDKIGQLSTPSSLPNLSPASTVIASSSNTARQDPLAQLMANPASLLASLNPASLGGAGDLLNQTLRKSNTNDLIKNMLNEFIKNPSLSLADPNLLATLTASMPLGAQGLAGFNLPTPTSASSLPPTSSSGGSKTTANSLLNDFKQPTTGNSLMKRPRQESSSSTSSTSRHSSSASNPPATESSSSRRSSSSSSDRHDRKSSSSSDRKSSSSYQERSDKHGKHDKRVIGSSQQDNTNDNSSSRRSSSSLLAQQVPVSQQTVNQGQTSTLPTASTQSALPNPAATLNLATQFGGLNSFGGLLNLPGVNELMKQMSSFPGLAGALPRVSGAVNVSNSMSTANTAPVQTSSSGSEKSSSRRSRQSGASTSTSQPSPTINTSHHQQQAATNAALTNSLMNLAAQSNATNPYSNYANPLANPFLSFGMPNLGMNNPLGMGLFPNLFMPPGFPTPDQQQSQQSTNQTNNSLDGSSSKDKKMRYGRK